VTLYYVRINPEFDNNTCLNMQDLSANQKATGVWAQGAAAQHLQSLFGSGNRFLIEANAVAYLAGFVFAGTSTTPPSRTTPLTKSQYQSIGHESDGTSPTAAKTRRPVAAP
jgi:hypothetical protein